MAKYDPTMPNHETDPVFIHGETVNIDREIVSLITMVNTIPGICTKASCQGENSPEGKNVTSAYFMFESDSWLQLGNILFNKIYPAIVDVKDPTTGNGGVFCSCSLILTGFKGFRASLNWNKRCTKAVYDALKPLADQAETS